MTGLVIKRHTFFELPAPQSVIDRVTTLALKSGVSRELIFTNRNGIPFSWSTTDDYGTADANPAPVAFYPDLPAEMPGVLVQHHLRPSPASMTPVPQPDPNWTQLADEAAENADLDFTKALSPLPRVVDVNNEDVLQVLMIQPTNTLTKRLCVSVRVPNIEHSSDTSAPLPPPLNSRHVTPHACVVLLYISMTTFLQW